MQPLSNFILIEPEAAEEKTKGGLYVPERNKERPQRGKALAIGPGATAANGSRIPMEVKIGDLVLYGQFAGTDVQVEGKNLLLLRENEALAIL